MRARPRANGDVPLGAGRPQYERDSIKGNQINATFGAGRLLRPGVLVGVVGGYENFKYEFDSLNGRLQSNGWTSRRLCQRRGKKRWRASQVCNRTTRAICGKQHDGMARTCN